MTAPLLLPAPDVTVAPVTLAVRESVLRQAKAVHTLPPGLTIWQMAQALDLKAQPGCRLVIALDGAAVPPARWEATRPLPGAIVAAYQVPMGGRGAGTGKQIASLVASIAIAVAAAYTGGAAAAAYGGFGTFAGAAAGSLAGAAATVAGAVALNQLVQIPPPGAVTQERPSTVTGQRNDIRQLAPIPRVFGAVRMSPPHAALPYTEVRGDDLILRMLLTCGYGPLEISNIRIGNSPLSAFEHEVEILSGAPGDPSPGLYHRDVTEDSPGLEIKFGQPETRVTAANTNRITVDLTFASGLYFQRSDGSTSSRTLQVAVESRLTGSGSPFTAFPGSPFTITARKPTLARFSYARAVAAGTYDVRVSRVTPDSPPGGKATDGFLWTALRSFAANVVVSKPGMSYIALAIKADGAIDNVNCLVKSILPDWNGSAWAPAITANPSAIGRALLQGAATARPAPDSKLRLDQFQAWHAYCTAQGLSFNGVFEDEATLRERLLTVMAAGRATLARPDGKYGVIVDELQTTPVAMITERNSYGFSAERNFADAPQALRISFVNESASYRPDERIVYDDGFNAGNIDQSRIERVDMTGSGVTNPSQIFKFGRYQLAAIKLRSETFQVSQGLESLVVSRGDLVRLRHDVLLIGLRAARITALTISSGLITAITLDDRVELQPGVAYAIRVRRIDAGGGDRFTVFAISGSGALAGSSWTDGSGWTDGTAWADTADSWTDGTGWSDGYGWSDSGPIEITDTLALAAPVAVAEGPHVGDLLSFGVAGTETLECIVRDIAPRPDFQADLTLIAAAPGIHEADTGPIPDHDPQITLPGDFFGQPPDTPVVDSIQVQELTAPGQPDLAKQVQLVINLKRASTQAPPALSYDVRLRGLGEDGFAERYAYPADSAQLTVPAKRVDITYELQVRANGRSPRGIANDSEWSVLASVYVAPPVRTAVSAGRVTGLELFGQAHDATFTGRNPTFTWRWVSAFGEVRIDPTTGQLIGFVDQSFSHFKVTIRSGSVTRRTDLVSVPQYTYGFEANAEDGRRLGSGPARTLEVEVVAIDRYGSESPPNRATFSNPAPAAPGGLSVTGGVGSLVVKCNPATDLDFEDLIVWGSTVTGFTPSAANRLGQVRGSVLGIDATPGASLFVRAAFADAFSSDPAQLNLSSELAVSVLSLSAVPEFRYEGITFTPNSPAANQVAWTAGTAHVVTDGVAQSFAVAAGSATWPGSGTLYLSYQAGSSVIVATGSIAAAVAADKNVIAVYRGGKDLTAGYGDVIIDGNKILAGTIGAQQIQAGIIDATHLSSSTLITDSAQIGNLVVGTINIADNAVTDSAGFIGALSIGVNAENNTLLLAQDTITTTAGKPVLVLISFDWSITAVTPSGAGELIQITFQLRRNGATVRSWVEEIASAAVMGPFNVNKIFVQTPNTTTATYQLLMSYNMPTRANDATVSAALRQMFLLQARK